MPDGWVPEEPDGWAFDEVPDNARWAEWQVLWIARVGTVGEFPRETTEPPQLTPVHCIARCCRETRDDGARGAEACTSSLRICRVIAERGQERDSPAWPLLSPAGLDVVSRLVAETARCAVEVSDTGVLYVPFYAQVWILRITCGGAVIDHQRSRGTCSFWTQ